MSRFYIKLDPLLVTIIGLSFATRLYKLAHPPSVVFDELHYIKFITLYLKRIFFFDPQPPLGKQLMAFWAYVSDFQGDLGYSQIGESYKPEVPIHALRLMPAVSGSILAPLIYLVSLELGFHQVPAALTSTLIILENSLLTQSRFILLEPTMILMSTCSLYCYLRFNRTRNVLWLCFASVAATLAVCIKYSGFYTYTLLLALTVYTWWNDIDAKNVLRKSITYLSLAVILPIIVYISIYYIHLSWLTKAGPHDTIMTSAFQASLENGLASITRGQPLEIVHGSQITLRHTHGRSCWLHSHEHLYPIKYSDGRGSSHQQQVTCYSFKDVNNWWIVKRPHVDDLVVTEPYDTVKDGDLIQLVHGLTGRPLNSHDVASPMSPYSQEVSCYVDHNISMPAQDLWRVKLSNPHDTQSRWHTLHSRLQLIHYNSSLALKFSGRQLADWGFHQHEIVADKEIKSEDTIWNVEEHRYTKSEKIELEQAEFIPLEPSSLSFYEKFYELHYKMLTYQQDMKDHLYASETPLDWILLTRGTAYWVQHSSEGVAQIFLIGNTTINTIGLISLSLFLMIFLYHTILKRRQITIKSVEANWPEMQLQVFVIIGGYLGNLIPYFVYESPLFLQYYLSATIFKILSIGALMNYSLYTMKNYISHAIVVVILAKALESFSKLSPLSYGTALSASDLDRVRLKETWHLITG